MNIRLVATSSKKKNSESVCKHLNTETECFTDLVTENTESIVHSCCGICRYKLRVWKTLALDKWPKFAVSTIGILYGINYQISTIGNGMNGP